MEGALAAHTLVAAASARAWPAPVDRGLRLAAYAELTAAPPLGGARCPCEPAQPLGQAGTPGFNPDMDSLPAALRAWCAQRLPPAAVPSVVVVLPRLPRSAAGKLARGALPPPSWADGALGLGLKLGLGSGSRLGSAPGPELQRVSPSKRAGLDAGTSGGGRPGRSERASASSGRGEVRATTTAVGAGGEARVLRAFAEALGLPRLEPAADFFAAGGDSLAAAAAAAALGIDARQVS